jgi:cell division protease FtsH
MNDMAKNLLLWIVIAVVLIAVFNSFNPHSSSPRDISIRTSCSRSRTTRSRR